MRKGGEPKIYTVSGKWNVSRVILRLCGWVYKTLAVEHSVVVMIVASQSERSKTESYGGANFRFPFYEIFAQNLWGA